MPKPRSHSVSLVASSQMQMPNIPGKRKMECSTNMISRTCLKLKAGFFHTAHLNQDAQNAALSAKLVAVSRATSSTSSTPVQQFHLSRPTQIPQPATARHDLGIRVSDPVVELLNRRFGCGSPIRITAGMAKLTSQAVQLEVQARLSVLRPGGLRPESSLANQYIFLN
jgi:hypothetical protein